MADGDANRVAEAIREMLTLDASWLEQVPRRPRRIEKAPAERAVSALPEMSSLPEMIHSPTTLVPDLPGDLAALESMAATCTRCILSSSRTKPVFGEGHPQARLMLIGEGPGASEDATGRPFVGPAGHLLDKILAAMGLRREETYICNVVKCRPPHNATPTPDQMAACLPYLRQQIALVRPHYIIALGATAARALLGGSDSVARMRGRFHKPGDIPILVTYHPAALLRDPSYKRLVWEDVQRVMARMKGQT